MNISLHEDFDRTVNQISYDIRLITTKNDAPGIHHVSEMSSEIFLCEYRAYKNTDTLRDFDISVVIYLGDKQFDDAFVIKNVQYLKISTKENLFEKGYDAILKSLNAKCKILLVCDDGISLSPAVLLYYFVKRYYRFRQHTTDKKIQADLVNMNKWYSKTFIHLIKGIRPCTNIKIIKPIVAMEYNLKENYREYLISRLPNMGDNENLPVDKKLLIYLSEDKPEEIEEIEEPPIGDHISYVGTP